MDSDLDPLIDDHQILATVEVDQPRTLNPSLLTYDSVSQRVHSSTPGSSLLIPAGPASAFNGAVVIPSHRFSPSVTSSSDSGDDRSPAPSYSDLNIDRHQPAYVPVIIPPPRYRFLPYSTSRTGVMYDVRMQLHRHLLEAHPENPFRISAVWEVLQEGGLVAKVDEEENDYHLIRLPIRPALEPEILLVHSPEHYAWVSALPHMPAEILEQMTEVYEPQHSIYVHHDSFLSALLAAGGAIDATKTVVQGMVRNAIAVIRPPGHHAEHGHASGFCFFNNVCVAAKVVQKEFPELCRKILILDWDVHHGNGVQHAFEDDPNVLYISLHVYENGNFYPHGPDGDHMHCGVGKGLGRNINIPWPTKGMGDAEYIYAFQQIVMPIGIEFDPDLVIISAGFDAADGDALGGCFVSPAGYSHMTYMLMQLAKGKVVACLEGGYGFESMGRYNPAPVAKSALAVARTLVGEPPERISNTTLHPAAVRIVREVIRVQSKFWHCLYPKDLDMQRKDRLGSQRLHDIVREWQSKKMWEEHKMSAIFIMRQKLSKSFENQVLATPNYHEARPLLVIFHDPPEAMGFPDPRTSQLELHNTWITDVSKTYVDWAVNHKFAVMDVNIPKHLTEIEDNAGYSDADKAQIRATATLEVANYLWRNYIEPGESTHVFFLGIGDAYLGLVELLKTHDSAAHDVTHTFNFIAENALRKVERPTDEGTEHEGKYYRRSTNFVSPEHPVWDLPPKKLSKKFGKLVKSTETMLQEMLLVHRDQVTQTLWNLTVDFRAAKPTALTPERTEDILQAATSLIPVAELANGVAPRTPGDGVLDKDIIMGGISTV